MVTDPISDLLIQIKNAYLARKKNLRLASSKRKVVVAKLLSEKKYLGKVSLVKKSKSHGDLVIELIYENKKPKITDIKIISKPGKRVYVKKNEYKKVLSGLGISLVSTSEGVMTDSQAKNKGLGGELICHLW